MKNGGLEVMRYMGMKAVEEFTLEKKLGEWVWKSEGVYESHERVHVKKTIVSESQQGGFEVVKNMYGHKGSGRVYVRKEKMGEAISNEVFEVGKYWSGGQGRSC